MRFVFFCWKRNSLYRCTWRFELFLYYFVTSLLSHSILAVFNYLPRFFFRVKKNIFSSLEASKLENLFFVVYSNYFLVSKMFSEIFCWTVAKENIIFLQLRYGRSQNMFAFDISQSNTSLGFEFLFLFWIRFDRK